MWNIWIDTGGTFTDCIGHDPSGTLHQFKILSNSTLRGKITKWINSTTCIFEATWPVANDIFENYEFKILDSNVSSVVESINFNLNQLRLKTPIHAEIEGFFEITSGEEVPVLATRLFTETPLTSELPPVSMRLGSTKGTNALLERKGAKTALLVTSGFKDLLLIGNQQRPDLFALHIEKSLPFYDAVFEVNERVNSSGTNIKGIDLSELNRLLKILQEGEYESIAISFMHAYRFSQHEQQLKTYLANKGFKNISISSEISSSIKYLERTQTTLINAYLDPVINTYLDGINKLLKGSLRIMTSAGGVVPHATFLPKDSLLSGPAGGVVGAANAAIQAGTNQIITLDIGGTSTDLAMYNGNYDYRYVTEINEAKVQSPALAIDTIAAGGGSIVSFDGYKITVGPESAGANPGPACYGNGGPLTLTDVNLLLGRISTSQFNIPINRKLSETAFEKLRNKINLLNKSALTSEQLLLAIIGIADEMMAEAVKRISIRKGHNPSNFSLLSFGGAGGQHACHIAELLDINHILIPYEAGILSARGIGEAEIENHQNLQLLSPLQETLSSLEEKFKTLEQESLNQLMEIEASGCYIRNRWIYLRFLGQEETLEISGQSVSDIKNTFESTYRAFYGHWLENQIIEIESIKVIGAIKSKPNQKSNRKELRPNVSLSREPEYQWENISPGITINGPALIISHNTTVYCGDQWNFTLDDNNTAHLERTLRETISQNQLQKEIELELFTNRFKAVAEEMGAVLERSSFSVNIRDRLDFSCGLLDSKGELIVNAPHIPVHLGSLGICVREVVKYLPLKEGDIAITNHPAFGGSHLPDVTLIAPFYYNHQLIGYVANRAHHAEIGGKSPGSMPADAHFLKEEGVIITPTLLVSNGKANWDSFEEILKNAAYPSRSTNENLADLRGAIASLQTGLNKLNTLCEKFSAEKVMKYMQELKHYAANLLQTAMDDKGITNASAEERLDDGTLIKVSIQKEQNNHFTIDFSGSDKTHSGNLNATPAIIQSAVLYTLRLLINHPLPLNEGLLNNISIKLPPGFLNPDFKGDPDQFPAVVGGNTEVSQRVTDTLIKALKLQACSQGTMNNLLFGNNNFGYYETICGGTGAGPSYHGASAVHSHMTNTKITDPEIMELRYPVIINEFSINENTGGKGQYSGGNGIKRHITFTAPVKVTLLSQHRIIPPFGLEGGEPGEVGSQYKITPSQKIPLPPIFTQDFLSGEGVLIQTPGGGGYGIKEN